MIKKINKVLFLATIFFGQSALAGSFDSGGCGELSILLVNTTQSTCKLTNQELIHGYVNNTSHIPSFIPPNTTAQPLDLEQSLMGIKIKLSYQCGENKKISLYAGQNYAFFSAGTITSQVIERHNMNIESFIREGNCFWGQHGTIGWNLID